MLCYLCLLDFGNSQTTTLPPWWWAGGAVYYFFGQLNLRGWLWIWGVPISNRWELLFPGKSRANKDTAVTKRIREIPTTTLRLRLHHPELGKFVPDWTSPTWEHLSLTPSTTWTSHLSQSKSDMLIVVKLGGGALGSPAWGTCQLKQGREWYNKSFITQFESQTSPPHCQFCSLKSSVMSYCKDVLFHDRWI